MRKTVMYQEGPRPLQRYNNYIMAYDPKGNYIGTIYFSAAGLTLKGGRFGKKPIADMTWEELFEKFGGTTARRAA